MFRHHGPFHNIGATYDTLMKWVEANGYQVAGYPREVYLSLDKAAPETWITEIQFPIQPAR